MENIQVKEIIGLASCLEEDNGQDSYNKSYCHFIKYFNERDEITEHDLIIGANFTYGWMPTILNFKSDEFGSAVSILNRAKELERITDAQLNTLKKLINNSLVGVSKLLHFVNPDVYAIWDSRICKFLTGRAYKHKVEMTHLFWSYLDLCKRVSSDPEFKIIHERYKEKIGFEVSPMRTVEQIMFKNSDNPIRS